MWRSDGRQTRFGLNKESVPWRDAPGPESCSDLSWVMRPRFSCPLPVCTGFKSCPYQRTATNSRPQQEPISSPGQPLSNTPSCFLLRAVSSLPWSPLGSDCPMVVNYLAAICLSLTLVPSVPARQCTFRAAFSVILAAQCTSLGPLSQLSHLQPEGDGNCIYLPRIRLILTGDPRPTLCLL